MVIGEVFSWVEVKDEYEISFFEYNYFVGFVFEWDECLGCCELVVFGFCGVY